MKILLNLSKSMKTQIFFPLFIFLSLTVSVQADLVHQYYFDAADSLDDAGSIDNDLTVVAAGSGTVDTTTTLGVASFPGGSDDAYLDFSQNVALGNDAHVVSLWFRTNQSSQEDKSALFSSRSGWTVGMYQVRVNGGSLQFTGRAANGVDYFQYTLAAMTDLADGKWYLLTVRVTAIGAEAWISSEDAGESTVVSGTEILYEPTDAAIGAGNTRTLRFAGDIADVRIYDSSSTWDQATQDQVFAAGPQLGAPVPTTGTLIQIGMIGGLLLPSAWLALQQQRRGNSPGVSSDRPRHEGF